MLIEFVKLDFKNDFAPTKKKDGKNLLENLKSLW